MAIDLAQAIVHATKSGFFPGTAQPDSVSVALGSPTTTGNTILVVGTGSCNTGGARLAQGLVTDSDGNFYSLIYSTPGISAFPADPYIVIWAAHSISGLNSGGSNTITMQATADNVVPPITYAFGISVLELSGVLTYPVLTSSGEILNAGGSSITINDHLGNPFTTSAGSSSFIAFESGFAVIDTTSTSADIWAAIYVNPSFPAGFVLPTATPPSFTYTQVDTYAVSDLLAYIFFRSFPIPTSPLVITCGSPPSGTAGVPYTHTFPVSGGTGPFTFDITSGVLPTGVTLDSSTGVVSGTPLAFGDFPFTIRVTDSTTATDSVACSISIVDTIAITCDSPPDGITGIAYTHTFPATGGVTPYTFSILSGTLPTGITLNASTGVASGTPTTPGTYTFTIQVTDAIDATANVACSIAIHAVLAISCAAPPDGTVGTPYTHTFPVSGGITPYTFTITSGSLPPGITLDTATGIVSGTPTTAGPFSFTIQVTDSQDPAAHQNCSITIDIAPAIIASCNNPPPGTVGTAYTHTFLATGGTAPYTFSITAGALPDGLTLSDAGVVTGTPATDGTFPFTVHVVDVNALTADIDCSITINPVGPPPLVAGCPIATGNVGSPYVGILPAAGGVPPYTFTITSGSFPSGLTFDPATATISGTPDILEQTTTFTWRLTDSTGNFIETGCSIKILCPTGSELSKFMLWNLKYVTEPADRAEVVHSTDWDDLGWIWDKKLQNMTLEYDGSAGTVTFQMETLIGIEGTTPGPSMFFPLTGASRSKQPFPIPDETIVKMVRVSPTTAPALDFKSWRYTFDFIKYPIDISLFTDRTIFGYTCEKIATVLELDIDTGGVPATIQLFADGALKQTVTVTTNKDDRSRIIALQPEQIGREWWLELQPGIGGKAQLFNWSCQTVKEPCAVSFFSTYVQRFGYNGYKVLKQLWIAYQSTDTITVQIFVDGGNLFWTQVLPAHPFRDEERFYVPAIDNTGQFLNKSKSYEVTVTATTGTMKIYSDSLVEWVALGAGQRLQRFFISEREQMATS